MLETIAKVNTSVNNFIWGVPAMGLMWDIADTFNGLMAIPNLIALLLLSGTVIQLTKEHLDKN